MSKGQRLRALVNERLTAAAEDIFALFERTIAEYEEELCRSKEENERKQQLLDSVLSPQVLVHRADVKPRNQEEVGPSSKQENTDCPQIKEEPDPCIQWEQDFLLTPKLDYTEPKLENSTKNWEAPIDEDIEADGEDCDQQKESNSISTLYNLGHNTSPESRNMVQNETVGPEKSNPAVKKNRGPKLRYCSLCEYKCTSSQDLMRHMSIHTGEKPFSCPVCDKRFTQKCSLKFHMAMHTGESFFSCPVCKKDFVRRSSLTLHMAMHKKVKPFSCPVCNRGFTQKGNMKAHMKAHMTTHTDVKPRNQEEAGPSPKQENTDCPQIKEEPDLCIQWEQDFPLTPKPVVHTGEKPFSCPVCDKRFTQKCSLKFHMAMHTGESFFSCPVCKKDFVRRSSLTLHMAMHKKVKPFSCPVCNRGFTQKGNMKAHMTTHTGDKPFSCPYCDKCFTKKQQMKLHMSSHTEVR